MDVIKRIRMIQIIEKIERNKNFSEKIGIENQSSFHIKEEKKKENCV